MDVLDRNENDNNQEPEDEDLGDDDEDADDIDEDESDEVEEEEERTSPKKKTKNNEKQMNTSNTPKADEPDISLINMNRKQEIAKGKAILNQLSKNSSFILFFVRYLL
jgi:hypothetical protein